MRQETEWGYIDWEYLPSPNDPKRWFSVGTTCILPGKGMPPHVHYANEQFLYILQGEADVKFNGKEFHVKAGDHFSLESDTTHEAVNTGTEPYKELMVTNPMPLAEGSFQGLTRAIRRNDIDPKLDEANNKKLRTAAAALQGEILEGVSIPYCLFDGTGEVILQNDRYPAVCTSYCQPAFAPQECPCHTCSVADAEATEIEGIYRYTCPHRMSVYLIPVLLNDRIAGILRGGQHFYSEGDIAEEARDDRYDTPYGTRLGIRQTLGRIARRLARFCEMLDAEQTISDAEEKVTNLKIDHHFLFNTLNSLAGMALSGNRMELYTGIVDLSKLFRYSLQQGDRMAPLQQELDYLSAYLDLQKLRYHDDLSVRISVDDDCKEVSVPFNFLQPIAENAFTHSFIDYEQKKTLAIRAYAQASQVFIEVESNGNAPNPEDVARITEGWASASGHGLSFIYEKLRRCYGSDFDLRMDLTHSGHTRVTVRIPR